jgi:hypothetical protein
VSIERLPGDHLALMCDAGDCAMDGPTKRGVTEDELLDAAEAIGWSVDREFGLHYCGLHKMHDCAVCGATTRDAITDERSAETVYYCREHWPL